MRTVRVGRFGSARVWLDEPAEAAAPADAVLCRQIRPGHVPPRRKSVCIEAAIPRGARTEYGLLGITSVGGGQELLVELPISASGSEWHSPLVASSEQASVGLRPEYGDAILGAIEETATGRIGPGVLRLSQAACGLVGSSRNFMARLARAAVEILAADVASDSNLEQLLSRFLLE